MTKINRETLKNYFQRGSVPSQAQFEDLVDSTLNIVDEGFDKTPADGLKVSQLGDAGKLISFFMDNLAGSPLYFIRVDRDENLVFGTDKSRNILFQPEQNGETGAKVMVGINTDQPENELHVGGVIRAEGRIGVAGNVDKQELKVPADGQWYNITDTLDGCQAFEIMAGAGGKRNQGKYALLHAIALNTFNPKGPLFNFFNNKNKIRSQSSYYRSRDDKLKLRWHDEGSRRYCLQLKSNRDYEDGTQIKYYLTQLWFDEDMSQSRAPDDEAGAGES